MKNLFLKELESFTDTYGNVYKSYEGFNRSVRYINQNGIVDYDAEKDIFYRHGEQILAQIKTYFKLVFCFHDDLVITPLSFNNLYEDYFDLNRFVGNFKDMDGKDFLFHIDYSINKVLIYHSDDKIPFAERNFIFQTID